MTYLSSAASHRRKQKLPLDFYTAEQQPVADETKTNNLNICEDGINDEIERLSIENVAASDT